MAYYNIIYLKYFLIMLTFYNKFILNLQFLLIVLDECFNSWGKSCVFLRWSCTGLRIHIKSMSLAASQYLINTNWKKIFSNFEIPHPTCLRIMMPTIFWSLNSLCRSRGTFMQLDEFLSFYNFQFDYYEEEIL